jgi:uncharacterized protein YebE (UPF0316 family)
MGFDNVILGAVAIFLMRLLSITLATVRFLIMGRANKAFVTGIAFVEALTFAVTFGVVAQDLSNLWNLFAYCFGFAAGTLAGTLVEARMATGFATVNIVSRGKSLPVAEAIRAAGFGATRSAGEGDTGTVGLVRVVVKRRDAARIMDIAQEIDPRSFVTVEEVRNVARGYLGYGRS